MKQTEYEQKKRECWEEYCKTHPMCNTPVMRLNFDWTFDRAYALGKQTETITHEEKERAAEEYAIQKTEQYIPESYGDMRHRRIAERFDSYDIQQAFEDGVNFALGKQENDADTVIQGWVCRDKKDNALNLHAEKPYRAQSGYDVCDEPDWWESDCASFLPLDKSLFPDLAWEADPEPVEIIIKRKKK